MAHRITSDRTHAVYKRLFDIHSGTLVEVAEAVGDKQARVLGHLRRLRQLGLVHLEGSKRGGIWRFIDVPQAPIQPRLFEDQGER